VSRRLRERLTGLVDSLDTLIYALLFLLGFAGLAYVAYVSLDETLGEPTRATFARPSSGAAMGVWLAIGVVAMSLAVALADSESGLRTWWALREDLRAARRGSSGLRGDGPTSSARAADSPARRRTVRD
jgi:hypothetical protein